jgi:hypothetical protein
LLAFVRPRSRVRLRFVLRVDSRGKVVGVSIENPLPGDRELPASSRRLKPRRRVAEKNRNEIDSFEVRDFSTDVLD